MNRFQKLQTVRENGFSPFCSDEEMAKYQFSCKQTTLKDLEENRY